MLQHLPTPRLKRFLIILTININTGKYKMSNKVNVKISFRLFGLLVLYFLEHCRDDDIEREICNELNDKMHAMMRRQEYIDMLKTREDLKNVYANKLQ